MPTQHSTGTHTELMFILLRNLICFLSSSRGPEDRVFFNSLFAFYLENKPCLCRVQWDLRPIPGRLSQPHRTAVSKPTHMVPPRHMMLAPVHQCSGRGWIAGGQTCKEHRILSILLTAIIPFHTVGSSDALSNYVLRSRTCWVLGFYY